MVPFLDHHTRTHKGQKYYGTGQRVPAGHNLCWNSAQYKSRVHYSAVGRDAIDFSRDPYSFSSQSRVAASFCGSSFLYTPFFVVKIVSRLASEAARSVQKVSLKFFPENPLIGFIHSSNMASIKLAFAINVTLEKQVEFRGSSRHIYRHPGEAIRRAI
jgi:hypothetical protein